MKALAMKLEQFDGISAIVEELQGKVGIRTIRVFGRQYHHSALRDHWHWGSFDQEDNVPHHTFVYTAKWMGLILRRILNDACVNVIVSLWGRYKTLNSMRSGGTIYSVKVNLPPEKSYSFWLSNSRQFTGSGLFTEPAGIVFHRMSHLVRLEP